MKKLNENVVRNVATVAVESLENLYRTVMSMETNGIGCVGSDEFKTSVDKANDALSRLYSLILYGKKKRKSR